MVIKHLPTVRPPLNLGQFRIENRTKENFNGSKKILNLAAPERLRGATTQTNFPHPAATTPGVPHPHTDSASLLGFDKNTAGTASTKALKKNNL